MSATRGDTLYRRAKLSDFEAVMAVNEDVYRGFDYLPVLYRPFMQARPDIHSFVAVKNGEVVSFVVLEVDEEDGVVTAGAWRTKEGYTGQGHNSRLIEYGMDYVRKLHSNKQMDKYVAARYSDYWSRVIKSGDWITMYTCTSLRYKITNTSLCAGLIPGKHPQAETVLTPKPVMFTDKGFIEKIASLLGNGNPHLVMLTPDHFGVKKVNSFNIRGLLKLFTCAVFMSGDDVAVFSCSCAHAAKFGVVCNVHIWGGTESEVFLHILFHLYQCKSVCGCNDLGIRVKFDDGLSHEIIEGEMNKLGFFAETPPGRVTKFIIAKQA